MFVYGHEMVSAGQNGVVAMSMWKMTPLNIQALQALNFRNPYSNQGNMKHSKEQLKATSNSLGLSVIQTE